MPQIGPMRKRVTFQSEVNVGDGGGGSVLAWSAITTVWGQFMPERGSERLEGGRLEAPIAGRLRVRSFSTTEAVTTEDRVLIDSDPYQIRSVINPDQRNRYLEFVVERADARGVAV